MSGTRMRDIFKMQEQPELKARIAHGEPALHISPMFRCPLMECLEMTVGPMVFIDHEPGFVPPSERSLVERLLHALQNSAGSGLAFGPETLDACMLAEKCKIFRLGDAPLAGDQKHPLVSLATGFPA